MKNYKVDIEFKKGPAFSAPVIADSEKRASDAAVNYAFNCGFNYPVKQIKVTEES